MLFFGSSFLFRSTKRVLYDEYIHDVKPIVESYGGKYLIRSENLISLSCAWKPDRMILIRFPNKETLEKCFHSSEYLEISSKREQSVEVML